jgi:tetratricopeptide (TPR) repeat protein
MTAQQPNAAGGAGADRLERLERFYEAAVFDGDAGAVPAALEELDRLDAELALARGKILHARFLQEWHEDPLEEAELRRAVKLFERSGDDRGLGQALFWLAVVHQVVRGDHARALPLLDRAHELSLRVDDRLTRSYVVRHLAFIDLEGGRPAAARERLEESLRLRRELGFEPGVAAALLALAQLDAEHGDPADARARADEARAVAERCGALGVLRWIDGFEQQS